MHKALILKTTHVYLRNSHIQTNTCTYICTHIYTHRHMSTCSHTPAYSVRRLFEGSTQCEDTDWVPKVPAVTQQPWETMTLS